MELLDKIITIRDRRREDVEYNQFRKILCSTPLDIVINNMSMLNAIERNEYEWRQTFTFMYGYMLGKRAEREKNKNKTLM